MMLGEVPERVSGRSLAASIAPIEASQRSHMAACVGAKTNASE
jgi:hypothetical protein